MTCREMLCALLFSHCLIVSLCHFPRRHRSDNCSSGIKACARSTGSLAHYEVFSLAVRIRIMASQPFEPFCVENPTDWFLRMESAHSLLQASSGNTIDKKTYLLATMGSKASVLLTDLLAPTGVSDTKVTYDLMKTTLLSHLKSQHLEIAERCHFYSATQGPNETSSEFFGRLKKMAQYCNFGLALESMIRDRLVLGCRSIQARTKLLQIDPLTLKTV